MTAFTSKHPPPRRDDYVEAFVAELAAIDEQSPIDREEMVRLLAAEARRNKTSLDTAAATKAALRESLSNAGAFRGTYVMLMREQALGYLEGTPQYQELARIPVGLLRTGLLNGRPSSRRRTPRSSSSTPA